MKKIICLLLALTILLSISPTSLFAESLDTKEWEMTTEDGYKLKTSEKDGYVKTEMYDEKGNFVDSTTVDKKTGKVKLTQSNGTVTVSNINDYVSTSLNSDYNTEEPTPQIEGNPIEQGQQQSQELDSTGISIQSLISEPVDDTGLANSVWSGDTGYKFLGTATDLGHTGYLYRKIDSMTKHKVKQFTFSAGTTISTILSVVVSVMTGFTWTAAILTSLFITSAGVLVDYFSGTLDARTYNYLYKVRVIGSKVYHNTYRNITYLVSTSDLTGKKRFKQYSFNHGASSGNFFIVSQGIMNYINNP